MTSPVTDQSAQALRALWFDFLDQLEPLRPRLHAYCLRLSGSVWEAEDLVQESLLRAFAVMGRGDLHGEHSRFDSPQAYLGQIATHLWIDRLRRQRREAAALAGDEGASPQERAAVVLKDVFDFSLGDIADILATTPGAVKAALNRGRAKLREERPELPPRATAASRALVERFIAAFNARDITAVVALLLESATWEVPGVGGERGRDTIWLKVEAPAGLLAEPCEIDGELAVAFLDQDGRRLVGLERLEEADARICRIVNYAFCPDTLAYAAATLDLACRPASHHQADPTLGAMIADTRRPWRGP